MYTVTPVYLVTLEKQGKMLLKNFNTKKKKNGTGGHMRSKT